MMTEKIHSVLKNIDIARGHHARILVGNKEDILTSVKNDLSKEFGPAFVSSANPDFIARAYENFGVEDGREISSSQSRRPASENGRFFILAIDSITSQAQNALLKTLEEPGLDNHFIIIARNEGVFLPTVLSRCEVVNFAAKGGTFSDDVIQLANDFLSGDTAKRKKIADGLLGDELDDEAKNKIKEFINCLLFLSRERVDPVNAGAKDLHGLETLSQISSTLDSKVASPKLLLPHLILMLPKS